jgi:hypothetical protein
MRTKEVAQIQTSHRSSILDNAVIRFSNQFQAHVVLPRLRLRV